MDNYISMPKLDGISPEGMERITDIIPEFSFDTVVKELTAGGNYFQPDKIFELLIKIFASELYTAVKILTVIVGIVMISALLENLKNSFGKSAYNANIAAMALIMGLAIKVFSDSSEYARSVSGDLSVMMNAILPVMMTLTAGGGNVSVGVITNPILLYMCNIFSVLFDKILIPMSVAYLAISMADLISTTVELEKFRELIKKVYNFILGIIMTVFTGLLSVGSFAGAALDSVGARGAKFALSNMVPFVGRSIAEAMNAVASASAVLKNAVGITGIIAMLALCIAPVIKIAVVILCIRASAAVCESIADRRTIGILTCMGDSLSMINASVISIVVMMVISIGIVVGIGG